MRLESRKRQIKLINEIRKKNIRNGAIFLRFGDSQISRLRAQNLEYNFSLSWFREKFKNAISPQIVIIIDNYSSNLTCYGEPVAVSADKF